MKENIDELLSLSENFDPMGQITKAMKLRKINQRELGEKLNVKPSTVSMWLGKTNNINLIDFVKIVNILDMPYEYFLKTRKEINRSGNIQNDEIRQIMCHLSDVESLFLNYSLRKDLPKKDERFMKSIMDFLHNYLKDLDSDND